MTTITNCMKKLEFLWFAITVRAFNNIKFKILEIPILIHQVALDAFGIGIGGSLVIRVILWPTLVKKLVMISKDISHMIKNFMLLFKLLDFGNIIFHPRNVLYSDHLSLGYIQSLKKFIARHAKLVEFLQDYIHFCS